MALTQREIEELSRTEVAQAQRRETRESIAEKPINPKDTLAISKAPLELVPDSMAAVASLAFLEGASKYGRFNWRVSGVSASVYVGAARRHLASWFNGEEYDPKTRVPHLASALACIGIIVDAILCNKLSDDRPPRAQVGQLLRELEEEVPRVRALFADKHPRHCTIADTEDSDA